MSTRVFIAAHLEIVIHLQSRITSRLCWFQLTELRSATGSLQRYSRTLMSVLCHRLIAVQPLERISPLPKKEMMERDVLVREKLYTHKQSYFLICLMTPDYRSQTIQTQTQMAPRIASAIFGI